MRYTGLAGIVLLALAPMAATAGGYVEPEAAAPLPVAPPPAPVGYDWTGFYGGVQLEYGDVQIDDNAGNPFADGTGELYGLFGGYRYDFGMFTLGAEVDLMIASIDVGGSFGGTIDSVHRLGVEAGYDAGPALLYGTVGVAQASATRAGVDLQDNGIFYGAGIDYLVTDQIVVGAEVLQHDFDDFDGSTLDVGVTTFGINAAFRF